MQGARFYTCKEPDDRSSSRDGRENSAEEEPSALLGNKSSKSTALVHQHHVRDSKQTNMSGVSAGHCHIVTGNEKNFKPVAQYKTAKEVMDDPAVQEQRKNRIDVLNNKNGKKKLHVDFVLDDELVQFIRENAVWEKEMLASNKTKTKTNGNKNRELLANKDPIVRLSLALDFWGYEIDLEFQPDGEVHYVLLRHVLPDSKPDLGNIVKRVAGKMKKKSAARGGATSSASGKKTGIKKSQSKNPSSKNGSSKGKKMATMKAPATKGKAAGTTNTTQSVKTKRKKQTGKKNSPSVQTTKKSSVQTTKKSSVQTSNKSSVAPKSSKGVKMGTGQKKKSSGGGKKPTGAAPKSTKKTGGNNTKKMNKMKSAKNVKKTDGKRKMQ